MKRLHLTSLLPVLLLALLLTVPASAEESLSNFKSVNTYKPFTDVPASEWFAPSVQKAYELGLLRGDSDTTFNPDGDVTIMETVVLACRVHNIYYGGDGKFVQGDPWYQVYLDYAVDNGILWSASAYQIAAPATRAEFVEILAAALPEEALPAINTVESIPDVRTAEVIYRFYRAGILTGSDAYGTFQLDSPIVRAEVAAIAARLADPAERKHFSAPTAPITPGAVRLTLGTQTVFSDMTALDLSYCDVQDISPLAQCKNLTELRISGNSITDLSVLRGLTNLTTLVISDNGIDDLSPLAGLTKLAVLDLKWTNVSDISPLRGLTDLTYLSLEGDYAVTDISPLAGLTKLTELILFRTGVEDVSALRGLTGLTCLDLGWTSVSDISSLGGLTGLTRLNLRCTGITDISPLAGLASLTYLDLNADFIDDISALRGLTGLTYLDLGGVPITDVTPLGALVNLTHLDLDETSVADFTPVSFVPNLGY